MSKNNLSITSEIVDKLRTYSTKLIKNNIKLIKSISNDECDMIDTLFETHKNKTKIKDIIFHISSENTKTAEKVIDEIEFFSYRLAKGSLNKENGNEYCPFLSSIWWGDYYGAKGIKGLIMLYDELKQNMCACEPENLQAQVSDALFENEKE